YGDVTRVPRADYAVNGGCSLILSNGGPTDLAQGDDATWWRDHSSTKNFCGISHLHTAGSSPAITDGLGSSYRVGEKYVEADQYASGKSVGDNESMYAGYCTDLHRFAGAGENVSLPIPSPPYAPPLNDNEVVLVGIDGAARFGSAHTNGFHMA